jgi:hypothetical protein
MLLEHSPTEWVNFNLPANLKPSSLETKIKSADAREQRANGHRTRSIQCACARCAASRLIVLAEA